jgi:IstB-like ATP binding protein
VEGETYSCEEIAAFNAGDLASGALTVIPDGAQVDLIGREGIDHVIRYQDRELTVPHHTILSEQPPQRTSPTLRLLLWREITPLMIRDLATLEQHTPAFANWRFDTFALDRPIVESCTWYGATLDTEQQRATLVALVEAIIAYVAQLPHAKRIAFCGPVGAGKSHLAFASVYAAAQQGLTAGYLEASQLPYQWRPSGLRALDAFREANLLVLDDLFISERPSSKSVGPVSELIANRRAQQRPTVFTSALPLKQLPDLVREDTAQIRLPISDHRLLHRRNDLLD